MRWPAKHTCHGTEQRITAPGEWRLPDLRHPFRSCNYCGSVHPEDFLQILSRPGARAEVADWKYGWPHKIYVHGIPEFVKFYTAHVGDDMDDEARAALRDAVWRATGIKFTLTPEGLHYQCVPYGSAPGAESQPP